jgi:outer membrane biosynthesis protein TonB
MEERITERSLSRSAGSLRSSLSISVALHAFLLFAWALLAGQQAAKNAQHRETIWIEMDPLAKIKKLQDKNSQRVVQTAAGNRTETPAPDANLGERNQIVDRQTVSAKRTTVMGQQARAHAKPSERVSEKSERAPEKAALPTPTLSKLGVPILPMQRKQAITQGDDSGPAPSASAPQDYIKG